VILSICFLARRVATNGARLNLRDFRKIVDQRPAGLIPFKGDPAALYAYAGLESQGSYQSRAVCDALIERIRNAFTSGHGEVWNTCKKLKTDLIREHVIKHVALDPYFEVLSHIENAVRAGASTSSEIVGDWTAAVQATQDHLEISNFRTVEHRRIYARDFAVAEAANFLDQQGYDVRLEPGFIALEKRADRSLRRKIEKLITQVGAVQVITRIFREISPFYDQDLQRYHLVPHMSVLGGGTPQVPWGYLLQLAVKHVNADSHEGRREFNEYWPKLLNLVTCYAAVVDVQPYYPPALRTFDSHSLIDFFREQALYDSMFRFPQLRASDILRLCRGALSFIDFAEQTPAGWTLNQAFELISFMIDPIRDVRGPIAMAESEFRRALPHLPESTLTLLLRDVFAHPIEGPNQRFSHPTDAPTLGDRLNGPDFYLKPLVRRPDNSYLIADRSACGWGYLEALLSALRPYDKQFDDKVGLAIEGFLHQKLLSHGVPTVSGDYDVTDAHGECDVVAETPQTVIFMELKKKTLTRRARAGVDADLLLDLAGSLLAALAQAGWHEVRLSKLGSLQLVRNGNSQMLSLDERSIEKIAVGMMDFGSFQDRPMLEKFMETTLNLTFGSPDPLYDKKFRAINDALQEIRDQYNLAHQGGAEIRQPFFNCWFVSVPQLLVLLDVVTDADSFRKALWSCRHMTTGTSDLYFEISNMRRLASNSETTAQG
jgi:hypothetical protein